LPNPWLEAERIAFRIIAVLTAIAGVLWIWRGFLFGVNHAAITPGNTTDRARLKFVPSIRECSRLCQPGALPPAVMGSEKGHRDRMAAW
jgi:hypothetical protein